MGRRRAFIGVIGALAVVLASCGGTPSAATTTPGSGSPTSSTVPVESDTTIAFADAPTTTAAPTTSSTTLPPTTTTTSTTTTTAPPTTTVPSTTTTTLAEASSYSRVPKPGGGVNAVAPGGALTKHLVADIASAFGFERGDVEAAIAGVALPPEAGGNPEGWLAPGAYEPAGGAGPADVLQAMVDRRVEQLEARGVPRDQWHRVLTAASVIEKETYNQNEKPNVARVLTNRLAGGGPLQMDSIILYPVPEDRIFTTSAERASSQPYNSYKHNGLPPTPICSPDTASIDAFLSPPPGSWWFYVTINLHSGDTLYANTYEEHKVNVVLLRAWLQENPTP
ncbi:MAG: hypothetical protein HKM97_00240 [Acidimicrobiia bacterium]|nr:hypothetical protein [Acidimicrobiia bacterium]